MPGRIHSDRDGGRTDYPVSLLQAAAALYGRDAIEDLAEPASRAGATTKSEKKSRE
ncbi:MAG TPA: hypothetical protein VJ762_15975 [Sphingobium sp.]|nr:hypothetical protein [Sphingobium sp.]